MDTRDGKIIPPEDLKGLQKEIQDLSVRDDLLYLMEMGYHPTPEQRAAGKVGRNDPCPCGSQKKFKHCHLGKIVRPPPCPDL